MAATVSIPNSLINSDRESTANMRRRASRMRASALFSELTWEECTYIAHMAASKSLARNETFFQQGTPVRCVGLIESGAMKLLQARPNGEEVVLWVRGEGEAIEAPSERRSARRACTARTGALHRSLLGG